MGEFTQLANESCNKALNVKTVWDWHKSRQKPMGRKKGPPKEIKDKDSIAEQCGEMIFWKMVLSQLTIHMEKVTLEPYLTPYSKANFLWIYGPKCKK